MTTAGNNEGPLRRGVVAVVCQQGRFLIIERSAFVTAPGMYCFPGGGIEPEEAEPEALCRELREELNVDVRPLRSIWRSVTPWRVELSWWQVILLTPDTLCCNPAEVASHHWLTADECVRLPNLLASNHEFFAELAQDRIELSG